jgi:hypothetical protein
MECDMSPLSPPPTIAGNGMNRIPAVKQSDFWTIARHDEEAQGVA